jgi:hypothetical protein
LKVKNWIIVALIGALTLSLVGIVAAQDSTANVEVTVWQRIEDDALFLSTRPEGGRWTTHRRVLDMSRISSSGRFRQGSAVTVAVPLPRREGGPSEPDFTPVYGQGQHNGVSYYAEESGFAYVYVDETGEDTRSRYYRFYLVCEESEYVHVSVYTSYLYDSFPGQDGDFLSVTYQIDDQPLVQENWKRTNKRQLNSHTYPDALQGGRTLRVWLPNAVKTFDISGLYDTVVQGNIDNCGGY